MVPVVRVRYLHNNRQHKDEKLEKITSYVGVFVPNLRVPVAGNKLLGVPLVINYYYYYWL